MASTEFKEKLFMPSLNAKVGLQPMTFKDTDFPTICAKAKEAGYVGIECPIAGYLDRLGELKTTLSDHGLQCSSTYSVVHAYDQEQATQDVESVMKIGAALKRLGASLVVVAPARGRAMPRTETHKKDEVVSFAQALS